ncbi:MAG TPA: hypothetical protein VFE82_07330 [Ramlibacter sp.]|jgi:hypothetical protein|uniref:hypothetical protein n=1 Tax=Ramlibacter sp. TaxID=1917967 RepID=UPI002D2E35D3|nr:hypothetical protein [Ramlibacter sp.]HZY18277.1 hypothetical protein [Ramlibacter sp.]
MRAAVAVSLLCASFALGGCLEVEQHPGWHQGQYDGKRDNLPQQARFAGDRLAWYAAIADRNRRQDEYRRTPEKGGPP